MEDAQNYEVIFTQRAFNSIVTETIHKHPIETGGVLLGYVLDTGVWVVVENIFPGYLAKHRWAEFSYDDDFTQYLADAVNRQYGGKLQVLGLWHRHPSSMDTFSSVDDETNLKYAHLSQLGAISALVNCDPQMRLTMYHVNGHCQYTRIPWMVDDGTLIPESFTALSYTSPELLPSFDRNGILPTADSPAPAEAIETDNLPSHELPEERALIPTSLSKASAEKIACPLKGYYVAETHIYNIFAPDSPADPAHTQVLGYLFPENILRKLGAEVEDRIQYLSPIVDTENPLLQRLRDILAAKKLSAIPPRHLSLAYLRTALGELYHQAPATWWNQEFLPALNGRADTHTLLGERLEDGSVRLVRIGSALIEVKQESYSLQLDVFSRNTGILESGIMLNKGAILIGCGSVGSLMAVELAKAGVGRFLLIDSDIFAYHNICRHQCGIYDVGRHKTDALAERLLQINPHAHIIRQPRTIQEVDPDLLADFCSKGAIFIAGADNHEGNLYACKRAKESGTPFISIGCWERACAGTIFYHISPDAPDYEDYLEAVGYEGGVVTQNRHFYTTEEDLAKVSFEPGISADINFVTIVALKLVLDILNRDSEGHRQRLLPHLTELTLVCNTNNTDIAGEQVEIFSYPLQVTTSIRVPRIQQSAQQSE